MAASTNEDDEDLRRSARPRRGQTRPTFRRPGGDIDRRMRQADYRREPACGCRGARSSDLSWLNNGAMPSPPGAGITSTKTCLPATA
jgi:hypothetical protein